MKYNAPVVPLHAEAVGEQTDAPPWSAHRWGRWGAIVSGLSTEQIGAFDLLLHAYWLKQGPLPDDDVELARIAGLSLAAWRRRVRNALIDRDRFHVADSMWHSEFMDRAIREWHERSHHGRKAATARWKRKGGAE